MKISINKNSIKIVFFILINAVTIATFYQFTNPRLKQSVFEPNEYLLSDTLLVHDDYRQCGTINLNKFIKLASERGTSQFDQRTIKRFSSRGHDSITFVSSDPAMFFGTDGGRWWREEKAYSNLPISFPDGVRGGAFTAAVEKINGTEYIYIPYQILLCVSQYNFRQSDQPKTVVIKDETLNKIEIGDLLTKHLFADVLLKNGWNNIPDTDKINNLINFVKQHWNETDTPVSHTISDIVSSYYISVENKYDGTPRDFALLISAMAEQLGFRSSVKGSTAYYYIENNRKSVHL